MAFYPYSRLNFAYFGDTYALKLPRIPYDSKVLERVTDELQRYVGARIQQAWQPNDLTIVVELYGAGESYLLLSADPVDARIHLTTARGRNQDEPTPFLSACRSNLVGKRIDAIRQLRGDRVFEIEAHEFVLTAELMGKHSNLILHHGGKVIDAAKRIGVSKSSRIILPGKSFAPAPTLGQGGESPFFRRLQEAGPLVPGAFFSPDHGAYPFDPAPLGYERLVRDNLNVALNQHFSTEVPRREAEQLAASLRGQLKRVLEARETALHGLDEAADAGGMAARWQQMGELLLAYSSQMEPELARFETEDYKGNPILIKLDPEKTAIENANRYFEKAKKAKARLPMVEEQRGHLRREREELESALLRLEGEPKLREVEDVAELARTKRWLNRPNLAQVEKSERPYQGHRVKEVLGPHGFTILYGENAAANDFLTMRVAKPDDWWLHVRGGVSAHAVIPTSRKPEKVPTEALLFAAKIVVANSVMKHASYVPVDYTLRKYVRKPRGSKAGTVLYTHEKTLYVD